MKCSNCQRELKDDSNFCDWCGNIVKKEEPDGLTFNMKAFYIGAVISIILSLILSGLAGAFGFPLLIGGLFLPLLWKKKKKEGMH